MADRSVEIALVVCHVLVTLIQKLLPCWTEPNIWQLTSHFSVGLNLKVLISDKFRLTQWDLKVSEQVG